MNKSISQKGQAGVLTDDAIFTVMEKKRLVFDMFQLD